jgi:hypothetical protein
MTFKPLTADRGEELLTLFLEDFRAKTSQQPDKAQGLTEPDQGCGHIWQELLARYDPATSLWKTPQFSLLGDYTEFLETWPRWGSMHDGVSYQQQTLVRPTSETESGLWPTPATKGYGHAAEGMVGNLIQKIEQGVITKSEAEQMLKLPKLENHRTWKKKFPTPNAQDHKAGMSNAPGRQQSSLPRTIAIELGTTQKESGGLNPTWVEWLMGWPLEWTDLKPLEMDKFRSWQQQHGIY